ncbi:MAG: AbgT family transporter [Bacilli bacterium]
MAKKQKQKRLLAPIITMIILILIVAIGSSILSFLNVEATQTMIVGGSLETTVSIVKNIFSKEGVIHFFSNIITNFSLLEPFILLIISLMAISIGKASGLFKHLFSPLKKINSKVLTFIIILISVGATAIGDYSYIILIPLVAVLYQYLGKSPVLGIVTVFLGITLGYGTGLLYNYNDFALGTLTQASAIIDVDASYKFSLYSNLYIMLISTVIISYILTMLVEKYLSKKVVVTENYDDELKTNKKSLLASIITFIIMLTFIIISILPGGILLDNTQTVYIAKLFSATAPFNLSFMYLFLMIMSICSLVYGFTSKNFKDNHEFCWGFTKQFDKIGYLFILMFLASILTGIIDWTNVGVVIANKLIYLLSLFDFTGIPLIIISFIFIALMSILIPTSLEKWVLISPVLIPLFMRGNLTPDFAQFLFKVADSIGKIITPAFIYFVIMVGFIQKYNHKENKVTLFGTFKLIWPIIITMIIFWLLLLIIWYIAGLPLGIGTLATM